MNAKGPVLPLAEAAGKIFEEIKNWFSSTCWTSLLGSGIILLICITVLLCLLPVCIRAIGGSLQSLHTAVHELRLRHEEGGDVRASEGPGKA